MTQMKVYDNRLTLWNAGNLPEKLSIEQLFQAHESIPRNPLIAEVCYKVGYIDSWGRGVEKIADACKEAQLPNPQFIERAGGILVELSRTADELGNQLGNTKETILNEIKDNPKISGIQLAEKLGVRYIILILMLRNSVTLKMSLGQMDLFYLAKTGLVKQMPSVSFQNQDVMAEICVSQTWRPYVPQLA